MKIYFRNGIKYEIEDLKPSGGQSCAHITFFDHNGEEKDILLEGWGEPKNKAEFDFLLEEIEDRV